MIKSLLKILSIRTIFWAILLLMTLYVGISLRRINYASIPEPYVILDEHTNVWHGLSLRKTGIPTAWSILPFYIDESRVIGAGGPLEGFNLSVDGMKPTLNNFFSFPKPVVGLALFDFGRGINNTPLVQPYIDHPPFGAIVLSMLVSKNVNTLADVNDAYLRRSAIFISIITQLLVFILAFLITKKPIVGIVSSAIYGTAPSYLLLSRYALLENVLSPLILLGLILLILAKDRFEKNKIDIYIPSILLTAGAIGGFGALTKLVGWMFILANIILLILWKANIKYILFYIIPAFFVGALYFVWGLYLSPKLFLDLFVSQGTRDFIGSINLLVTFFRVSIYRFPLDGWWIGGFISLLFIPKDNKYLPIAITVVAIFFSALAIVGSNYPWYFIPLIPFTCISISMMFEQFARKPSFISTLFIFFTFVSSSFYWGYGVFQKFQPFNLYRMLFVLFIGIGIYWSISKNNVKYGRIWYLSVLILLICLFILNIRSVLFIIDNWGKLPLLYTPGTF